MTDRRDRAIQFMDAHNFAAALPIFLDLIKAAPTDWSLYYMAGQCCRFVNRISQAIELLNAAAKLNPTEAHVRLALGIAYQISDQHREAITHLKKAVEIQPDLVSAYNSLGLTYRKLAKYPAAIECYSAAAECHVNVMMREVEKDRARCFREDIVNGEKTLVVLPYLLEKTHKTLRSNPMYAVLKNNLGVSFLAAGDVESARASFLEAIEFIPAGYDYPDPHTNLKQIQGRR
jgi:tetratricopeptide (TPR) repeat protein